MFPECSLNVAQVPLADRRFDAVHTFRLVGFLLHRAGASLLQSN
jgi:hypothetical protein